MDERLRFVARLLEGEKMAVLCREFDVSRKTGYKIFARYKDCGLEGLTDRSRRPYRHANRLPFQTEKLIVQLKKEHSSWGTPKIREKLRRLHSGIQLPAISTVLGRRLPSRDPCSTISAVACNAFNDSNTNLQILANTLRKADQVGSCGSIQSGSQFGSAQSTTFLVRSLSRQEKSQAN